MAKYADEVEGLHAAYEAALTHPEAKKLNWAFDRVRGHSLFAVGSGGTMPVAEHAADLHHRVTGKFALAVTPLRFVELAGRTSNAALIIFSARAKHPDTGLAITHALTLGIPVVVVTQREQSDLESPMTEPGVTIVTVPGRGNDGFLATRSVLVMATVITRMYGENLPQRLPSFDSRVPATRGDRMLVLHAQEGRAAAGDIETRMHELGLMAVQVTDYRNFAHGRHVGLERRSDSTTVVALVSPASAGLAAKTLGMLPELVEVHEIETPLSGAAGALDLLAAAMALPIAVASTQGIEPSKPRVPSYGRNLYHLPFKRLYPAKQAGPILRKVQASGFGFAAGGAVELYSSAYEDWSNGLRQRPVQALVLDYDGTCVSTPGRFDLPDVSVQEALSRFLAAGLPLAFASGRGGSLHEDLRKWVPREFWHLISLGLHNGAWRLELSDELQDTMNPAPFWSERLQERLRPFADRNLINLRIRPSQVTVTSDKPEMTAASLRELVVSVVEPGDGECLHVASSGHSVDIIDEKFGKEKVFADFVARHGQTLAIGDQGQPGGNDFALLSADTMTVSVDACSADPTRCWNVAGVGSSGPPALVETLNKLVSRKGGLYLLLKKSDH
jgi:hypothetical protein